MNTFWLYRISSTIKRILGSFRSEDNGFDKRGGDGANCRSNSARKASLVPSVSNIFPDLFVLLL
jgi:hypothetical protein